MKKQYSSNRAENMSNQLAKSLEEISNENLINFYKNELESIERGIKASEILPKGVLKRFHKIGVFNIVKPRLFKLSEKAVNILKEPRR